MRTSQPVVTLAASFLVPWLRGVTARPASHEQPAATKPIIVLDQHGTPMLNHDLHLHDIHSLHFNKSDTSGLPSNLNDLPVKTSVNIGGESITIYALTQDHVEQAEPILRVFLCGNSEYFPLFPILCHTGRSETGHRLSSPGFTGWRGNKTVSHGPHWSDYEQRTSTLATLGRTTDHDQGSGSYTVRDSLESHRKAETGRLLASFVKGNKTTSTVLMITSTTILGRGSDIVIRTMDSSSNVSSDLPLPFGAEQSSKPTSITMLTSAISSDHGSGSGALITTIKAGSAGETAPNSHLRPGQYTPSAGQAIDISVLPSENNSDSPSSADNQARSTALPSDSLGGDGLHRTNTRTATRRVGFSRLTQSASRSFSSSDRSNTPVLPPQSPAALPTSSNEHLGEPTSITVHEALSRAPTTRRTHSTDYTAETSLSSRTHQVSETRDWTQTGIYTSRPVVSGAHRSKKYTLTQVSSWITFHGAPFSTQQSESGEGGQRTPMTKLDWAKELTSTFRVWPYHTNTDQTKYPSTASVNEVAAGGFGNDPEKFSDKSQLGSGDDRSQSSVQKGHEILEDTSMHTKWDEANIAAAQKLSTYEGWAEGVLHRAKEEVKKIANTISSALDFVNVFMGWA